MPKYDYRCPSCSIEFETSHGMNDKPEVKCPKCGIHAKRVYSACSFTVRNTGAVTAARERAKSERDIRHELSADYGVEKISPLGGASVQDVYKDVKQQGSFVRDKMQMTREQNAAKSLAKRRAWAVGANKRAPLKTKIVKEKRAEEAAAKRAIRL